MAVRLTKPWIPLTAAEVARLPAQLGVYQLGDDHGAVLFIGYAGGRSLFGLRGELERALGHAASFRLEVNQQYLTRYEELLMAYQADHGELPPQNRGTAPSRLGRLSPGQPPPSR